jgi:hypothetical protein
VVRRFGLFLPVDNHPAWAGCSFSRATLTAFASNAHTGQTSRLSSVFFSLQRYPIEPAHLFQWRPATGSIPLQRLMRSCGFSASTPLRRRLTSFAPATVVRDSLLRHRPLSRWRSAIGPAWLRSGRFHRIASVNEVDGDRQRSWDFLNPSQLCSCASQGSQWSSHLLEPRLPFHERPPRRIFFAGDRSPNSHPVYFTKSIDPGRSFRLPGFASALCASGKLTDLSDRNALAAVGFSCFRLAGRRN